LIGLVGGLFYHFTSELVLHLKIDDPLDAFSVHYGAGVWGLLAVGFFDKSTGLVYGHGFN